MGHQLLLISSDFWGFFSYFRLLLVTNDDHRCANSRMKATWTAFTAPFICKFSMKLWNYDRVPSVIGVVDCFQWIMAVYGCVINNLWVFPMFIGSSAASDAAGGRFFQRFPPYFFNFFHFFYKSMIWKIMKNPKMLLKVKWIDIK